MINKQELRKQVAQKLGCNEEDLIWSDTCANPKTMFHNQELGTVSFKSTGYWVKK